MASDVTLSFFKGMAPKKLMDWVQLLNPFTNIASTLTRGGKAASTEMEKLEGENSLAKTARNLVKQIESYEQSKRDVLKNMGSKVVDVKKSILTLAPILKRLDMLAKDAYSQANTQRAKTL
jgi:hypothetical protein